MVLRAVNPGTLADAPQATNLSSTHGALEFAVGPKSVDREPEELLSLSNTLPLIQSVQNKREKASSLVLTNFTPKLEGFAIPGTEQRLLGNFEYHTDLRCLDLAIERVRQLAGTPKSELLFLLEGYNPSQEPIPDADVTPNGIAFLKQVALKESIDILNPISNVAQPKCVVEVAKAVGARLNKSETESLALVTGSLVAEAANFDLKREGSSLDPKVIPFGVEAVRLASVADKVPTSILELYQSAELALDLAPDRIGKIMSFLDGKGVDLARLNESQSLPQGILNSVLTGKLPPIFDRKEILGALVILVSPSGPSPQYSTAFLKSIKLYHGEIASETIHSGLVTLLTQKQNNPDQFGVLSRRIGETLKEVQDRLTKEMVCDVLAKYPEKKVFVVGAGIFHRQSVLDGFGIVENIIPNSAPSTNAPGQHGVDNRVAPNGSLQKILAQATVPTNRDAEHLLKSLLTIAGSPQNPMHLRVAALLSMRGVSHPAVAALAESLRNDPDRRVRIGAATLVDSPDEEQRGLLQEIVSRGKVPINASYHENLDEQVDEMLSMEALDRLLKSGDPWSFKYVASVTPPKSEETYQKSAAAVQIALLAKSIDSSTNQALIARGEEVLVETFDSKKVGSPPLEVRSLVVALLPKSPKAQALFIEHTEALQREQVTSLYQVFDNAVTYAKALSGPLYLGAQKTIWDVFKREGSYSELDDKRFKENRNRSYDAALWTIKNIPMNSASGISRAYQDWQSGREEIRSSIENDQLDAATVIANHKGFSSSKQAEARRYLENYLEREVRSKTPNIDKCEKTLAVLGSENEVVKRLAGKVFGSPLVEEVLRGGCAHEVQNADLDMRPDLALLFLFAKDCRWDSTAQKLLKIAPAIEGSALRPFYNGGNLLDSGGKPKDFYFMYKTNVLNPFTFPDYYRYLNAYINNQMH